MAYKDTSKQWFKTGDYPLQSQFSSVFEWLRWKDELIEIGKVEGLVTALHNKADLVTLLPNATSINRSWMLEVIDPATGKAYLATVGQLLDLCEACNTAGTAYSQTFTIIRNGVDTSGLQGFILDMGDGSALYNFDQYMPGFAENQGRREIEFNLLTTYNMVLNMQNVLSNVHVSISENNINATATWDVDSDGNYHKVFAAGTPVPDITVVFNNADPYYGDTSVGGDNITEYDVIFGLTKIGPVTSHDQRYIIRSSGYLVLDETAEDWDGFSGSRPIPFNIGEAHTVVLDTYNPVEDSTIKIMEYGIDTTASWTIDDDGYYTKTYAADILVPDIEVVFIN